MTLKDIIKFQLKRVNPFQGLIIDADTWREAHNYHRDQQRLHLLAFHGTGIVQGCQVTANNPPDLSVNIHPGIAVDPEGNIIIVPQLHRYQLQTRQKGVVYLIIQFREIPGEPYQPPEGGQPTRILEAYRIQERDKLPAEPYLELARIDFDPASEAIRDAKNPSRPGKNEINLGSRQEATRAPEPAPVPVREVTGDRTKETVAVGHIVLGKASKELHSAGLINLVKEVNREGLFTATLEQSVPLDSSIGRFTLVYLTGSGQFELSSEQQSALSRFLKSGGVIFGEGCFQGESRGAKEFGLAFNQLASQLGSKLEVVQRGHALLSVVNVFAEVPQGASPGMLLEGGNMIYSASDYGCAWQGGHQESPLARDIIRSSLEMGANVVAHARMMKGGQT